MKVVNYVPHGALPDIRGFAPAIVAWNLVKSYRLSQSYTLCNLETHSQQYELHPEAGHIHRLKEGALYRRLFKKMTRLDPYPLHARAAEIVNQINPDIFHAHQLELPVNDFLSRLKKKLPIVIHAHAVRTFKPDEGVADAYIAVAQYTKQRMIERGYPEEKIHVIHNGVDTHLFAPGSEEEKVILRKIVGIPADAIVMAYVGRKQEAKGFYRFLAVAKEMLEKHDQVFAFAVGPTPADPMPSEKRASYDRLLASLASNPRFLNMDAVPHRTLSALYKISDMVISATQDDQHPLVVIEAMATGNVVIVSNYAGIKESVQHGTTGFLLEDPTNMDELTATVEQTINQWPQMSGLIKAARQSAVEQYDWHSLAAKLERLYFELVQN